MPLIHDLFAPQTFSYLVVPLGVTVLSWCFQFGFSTKPNAAADIFAFSLALDIAILVQPEISSRLNPHLQHDCPRIFAVALLFSVAFLFYATRVQSLIYKHRPKKYYPWVAVTLCWAACFAIMGFYLYALAWS